MRKPQSPSTTVKVSEVQVLPGEVLTVWVSNQCGERTQVEIRSLLDTVTYSSPKRPHVGHPQIFVDSTDSEPVEVKPFSQWKSFEQEGIRSGGHWRGSDQQGEQ